MEPGEAHLDVNPAGTDFLYFHVREVAERTVAQPVVQIGVQVVFVGIVPEQVLPR